MILLRNIFRVIEIQSKTVTVGTNRPWFLIIIGYFDDWGSGPEREFDVLSGIIQLVVILPFSCDR